MGFWGHRSENVKLQGLDYVAYKMCQYTVLIKDKIVIHNVYCLVAINILLRW